MDAASLYTIREILKEYEVDSYMQPKEFDALVDALSNRENIMVTELGPRFLLKDGLDRIIKQV